MIDMDDQATRDVASFALVAVLDFAVSRAHLKAIVQQHLDGHATDDLLDSAVSVFEQSSDRLDRVYTQYLRTSSHSLRRELFGDGFPEDDPVGGEL